MKYQAELVFKIDAKHGECSWWDDLKQKQLFMDCAGHRLFEYDPLTKSAEEFKLPFNPEAVVGCKDGSYVACDETSVYKLDKDYNITEKLADVDLGKSSNRFNDCKCGPDGAYYMGTMGTCGEPDEGKLFRFTKEKELSVVLDKVGISNGFAWTKDLKTVYYTDTIHGEIYAYDYSDGKFSNKRVVFTDKSLQPDGMTIDNQDRLWVALWDSGKVICVEPKTGELLHEVCVEGAKLTSSACFGGKDFDTLYITTSRLGLKEDDLKAYPNSGSLFACKVDAKGSQLFRGEF